jgi:glycosyltransferase involved in cell wall biosynthesis
MPPQTVTSHHAHQKPWLSVVVATRNRASLLETALKGIQNQTFQNYEVIVVDDGSSEATRAQYPALSHMLGERFKFELLGSPDQPGHGPSVARNLGTRLTQGQVISFCDDDDYWFNSAHLAMMFNVFSAMPDLDMYIANQRAVFANGAIQSADWLPLLCNRVKLRQCQHECGYVVSVDDLCSSGGFAHLNTLAVKRSVVEQIQGFWERVGYEEDRDFFWRASDGCQHIFFNPIVVAQHNIPDAQKQDNQSTAHSWVERWMTATLVSQHISANVNSALIANSAVSYEGDLYRKLAIQFAASGQAAPAWQFGKRALAARFSFKWAGYLFYLKFKTYLARAAT